MADRSLSGLTEEDAKEVNGQFQMTFMAFLLIAAAAHVLVWIWKPWF